jgi:hypothetical protein
MPLADFLSNDAAFLQRKAGLGPIERLDLRLLAHTKHERSVGRHCLLPIQPVLTVY